MIEQALHLALNKATHPDELHQVMEYALFPTGKLFRPGLVEAVSIDLNKSMNEAQLHLACAIELHHAYSLVHDDLPAMDNDMMRRGKPATHAQYGEWKAILAGDALLIASFREMLEIDNRQLQKLFTWATGAKGLIKGQFMDLGANSSLSLKDIIRIHDLKTARLIQLSIFGAYLLSGKEQTHRTNLDYFRLGREIGLTFQLLDDLADLEVDQVTSHEKNINPFLLYPEAAFQELRISHLKTQNLLPKLNLAQTTAMLNDFFKESQQKLLRNFTKLERKSELSFWVKDLKEWLTNFA